jgi:hypothetical protein
MLLQITCCLIGIPFKQHDGILTSVSKTGKRGAVHEDRDMGRMALLPAEGRVNCRISLPWNPDWQGNRCVTPPLPLPPHRQNGFTIDWFRREECLGDPIVTE